MCDIYLNCTSDILTQLKSKNYPNYLALAEGSKIDLSSIHYSVGGGGANVACCLANLGFPITLFSKTGSDHLGNFVLSALSKKQINIDFCIISQTEETGTSLILPSENGNHPILVFRGANTSVTRSEIPASLFKNFNGIYITSLAGSFAKLLPDIATQAHQNGALVMHNPSKSEILNARESFLAALPNIDILIMNQSEAYLLFATIFSNKELFFHTKLYQYLEEKGPRTLIITLGKEGAYCITKQKIMHQPSIPAKVINTVGAGDIFGATFFGSIILGYSYREALVYAAHNSSAALASSDKEKRSLSFDEIISHSPQT